MAFIVPLEVPKKSHPHREAIIQEDWKEFLYQLLDSHPPPCLSPSLVASAKKATPNQFPAERLEGTVNRSRKARRPPTCMQFAPENADDELGSRDLNCDENYQVTGGTLDGLVALLTSHIENDPTFNKIFLLTLESFTTPQIFFSKLVGR